MILNGDMSNTLRTVARLPDSGAGPNLINKYFLPPVWKEAIKTIKYQQFQNGEQRGCEHRGHFAIGRWHSQPTRKSLVRECGKLSR